MFDHENWVYQQDGATRHTSNRSQSWCKNNLKYFLRKEKWPANSPDLSPLDYYLWNAIVTQMRPLDSATTKREGFIAEIKKAANSIPLCEIESDILLKNE